jgi:hypothetical protein
MQSFPSVYAFGKSTPHDVPNDIQVPHAARIGAHAIASSLEAQGAEIGISQLLRQIVARDGRVGDVSAGVGVGVGVVGVVAVGLFLHFLNVLAKAAGEALGVAGKGRGGGLGGREGVAGCGGLGGSSSRGGGCGGDIGEDRGADLLVQLCRWHR